jgi:hypothetical protein
VVATTSKIHALIPHPNGMMLVPTTGFWFIAMISRRLQHLFGRRSKDFLNYGSRTDVHGSDGHGLTRQPGKKESTKEGRAIKRGDFVSVQVVKCDFDSSYVRSPFPLVHYQRQPT